MENIKIEEGTTNILLLALDLKKKKKSSGFRFSAAKARLIRFMRLRNLENTVCTERMPVYHLLSFLLDVL